MSGLIEVLIGLKRIEKIGMGISFLEGPEAWLIDKKGREQRAESRVVGQTRLARRVAFQFNPIGKSHDSPVNEAWPNSAFIRIHYAISRNPRDFVLLETVQPGLSSIKRFCVGSCVVAGARRVTANSANISRSSRMDHSLLL